MDFAGEESRFPAPALVSLTPFTPMVTPSPRRLSSCFTQPSKPAVRAKRQLAWVSLQGRLVGAEEATAVTTIDTNGVLGAKEAAAWELFTPIQRVLVVAVVAAAAAHSRKDKKISQLQKSVELRDQVLLGMQQKLDNICDQLNYSKDQPEVVLLPSEVFSGKGLECGCKPCQQHPLPPNGCMFNAGMKGSNGDECFKYKMPAICVEAEPEERRMSDLSDWAPSVASSIDVQLDNFTIEHEINSLRKECEEKDAAIKELSTYIQSSEALGSKRIVELEDLIRRKNLIINKLRKDVIVLEQKVMNLTRLRRHSSAAASSNAQCLPTLTDNVLYDMDSTTGPSSSDSDDSSKSRRHTLSLKLQENSLEASEEASKVDLSSGQATSSASMDQGQNSCATSTPRWKLTNQTPSLVQASKTRQPMHASGESRTKRRHTTKSKEVTLHKRWV